MEEKNVVHISQFYPCTKVNVSVELAYIVEVSKYLHDKGMVLSLDGILFEEDLIESRFWDYFRMGVSEGWIIDVDCDMFIPIDIQFPIDYSVKLRNILIVEDEVAFDNTDFVRRRDDADYAYRTPFRSRVIFKSKENDVWLWDLNGNGKQSYISNNKTLNSAGSDICWISLVAYVAVQRFCTGKAICLLIDINDEVASTPDILSGLLLLQDETDVCTGWCFLHLDENISKDKVNHLGYASWYYKGLEKGYLCRWYSPSEKLTYMDKLDFKVGDVVSLYERYMGQKMNNMKSIGGFRVAIIKAITEIGITLEVINTKKTKYQGLLDYKNFSMSTKQMYDFQNPFAKINKSVKTLDWNDIGVEYMMFNERYFITPIYNDTPIYQNVSNSEGVSVELNLPPLDLTYWILKDYNVQFNDERLVKRYYGKRVPLYTEFQNTGKVGKQYYADKEA